MRLHWEALDERTAEVARAFGRAGLLRQFALVGGTALALWFGHRRSLNLDFFTAAAASELLTAEILSGMEAAGLVGEVVIRQADQLHLVIREVDTVR